MRLSVIQNILERVDYKVLSLGYERHGSGNHLIKNLSSIRETVSFISEIPSLRKRITPIQSSIIFSTADDSILVSSEARAEITNSLSVLSIACRTLLEVIETQKTPEKTDSIHIRLPDPSDFSQLLTSLEQFNKVLDQTIVHEDIQGSLKVPTWEAGSFWIEICLGTTAAVQVVAGITWAAAVIIKKRHEAEIIGEHVRSLKIKNDSLEDLKDGQKKAMDLLLENEAKNIQDEFYKDTDNHENLGRLCWAIKTFADLIHQGAEIHPALNAPEPVQNLFPNLKQMDTITSRIKQLTTGSSEEGE